MRTKLFPILCFLGLTCFLTVASAVETGGFTPDTNFFKVPADWTLGACSAVASNGQGEIYLLHRGKHPLICFDAEGKFLRSWGDDVLQMPHGLRVDRNDNVWITDIGSHRVFKFDRDGKALLALGTGKAGKETDQFDRPTDVAFGPDGEFYVSDGYGNTRVLKYSPSGALIKTWGTPGTGRGEFNLVHAIVLDKAGRLLVADRENRRIQIFDREGKWLDMWEGFSPFGMAFDGDWNLYVTDGLENEILRLNAAGKIEQRFGKKGTAPGELELPHMLGFDAKGNLYVAEVNGKRFQRFTKK